MTEKPMVESEAAAPSDLRVVLARLLEDHGRRSNAGELGRLLQGLLVASAALERALETAGALRDSNEVYAARVAHAAGNYTDG